MDLPFYTTKAKLICRATALDHIHALKECCTSINVSSATVNDTKIRLHVLLLIRMRLVAGKNECTPVIRQGLLDIGTRPASQ